MENASKSQAQILEHMYTAHTTYKHTNTHTNALTETNLYTRNTVNTCQDDSQLAI